MITPTVNKGPKVSVISDEERARIGVEAEKRRVVRARLAPLWSQATSILVACGLGTDEVNNATDTVDDLGHEGPGLDAHDAASLTHATFEMWQSLTQGDLEDEIATREKGLAEAQAKLETARAALVTHEKRAATLKETVSAVTALLITRDAIEAPQEEDGGED